LIWLHGTGIVTDDARNAFSDDRINFPNHCKIVLLKAMEDLSWHPVTDMGYWYEVAHQQDKQKREILYDVELNKVYDQEMIQNYTKYTIELLKQEIEIIGDASKVFIGGYSMGTTIALTAFLQLSSEYGHLGGIFCTSGLLCAEIDWS
jgi:predicted esterase